MKLKTAAWVFLFAATAFGGSLDVTVDAKAVRIKRLTAGGSALVCVETRAREGWFPEVARRVMVLSDDDRDGIVVWEAGRELPAMTIAAAVDLTSGEAAFGASPDYPYLPVLPTDLKVAPLARGVPLPDHPGPFVLLLVRPGYGAWWRAVERGEGPFGRDPQNVLPLEGLSQLHGKPIDALNIAPGDKLVLLDERHFCFYELPVGR